MSNHFPIPKALKIQKKLPNSFEVREDNYFWMKKRDSDSVLQYLKEENNYTDAWLKNYQNLHDELYQEMVNRVVKDDMSAPYFYKGFWYYSRFEGELEYPIFCRKKDSLDNEEEILLDVNILAKGHTYYKVVGLNISPDDRYLLFGEDTVGRRLYTLRMLDLQTRKFTKIKINYTDGGTVWASDSKTFFFTKQNKNTLRAYKIFSRNINESKNILRYTETNEIFDCGVQKTKSEKFILINSDSAITSEVRYIAADKPDDDFQIFYKRKRGLEYSISHFKNKWYILHNFNAQNFKISTCSMIHTDIISWQDLVPHREDTLLEGLEVFEDFFVIEERRRGQTHIFIQNLIEKKSFYLPFDSPTYDCWIDLNTDYNSTWLRIGHTSMTTPTKIEEINMFSLERRLIKSQKINGGYDENLYDSKRVLATARDGVQVPISLVYKKEFGIKDRPLLLYGYGSYGYSLDPYFSSVRLSLLDRGFVFAIAHVRGGEEMGRNWYEDGKFLKKKNTFYDFIDSAEFLIEKGITSREKLFAQGGSAGGLLMGAVMNIRPDLWKGVVAEVPFVDVLTTMLDDSIPLTTGEFDEWGNPNQKEYYHYMKSYSPYDNVAAKDYPSLLITAGYHDSQVQYWEALKWAAKLRDFKTDNNILLLKCDMDSGHSGASGRFESLKDVALNYTFLLSLIEF
jgi:oligopeptidase B